MDRGHRKVRDLKAKRMTRARRANERCCRCGEPIDYDLDPNDRMGPTCDHLDPLVHGGAMLATLDRLAPAHRSCNSSHGASLKRPGTPKPTEKPLRRSESW